MKSVVRVVAVVSLKGIRQIRPTFATLGKGL